MKTWLRICLACISMMVLGGCSVQNKMQPQEKDPNEGERISLIAIITKPEEYDGVRATVRGILRAEEEGIALYVFEEDAEYESHL